MRKEDLQLIQAVLSSKRKTRSEERHLDEKHIAEVIDAMHTCGFAVIPRGVVESLKKMLERIG